MKPKKIILRFFSNKMHGDTFREPLRDKLKANHPKNTNGDFLGYPEFTTFGKKREHRNCNRLAIILSAGALFIATILFGFIFFSPDLIKDIQAEKTNTEKEPQMTPVQEPQQVCLPCAKLHSDRNVDTSSDPLLKQLIIEVDDQGGKNCCAYTAQQKSALLEAILRLQASPHPPLFSFNVSDFRFSPVSAHMRIFSQYEKSDKVESPQLMKLGESDARSGREHHRNVRVSSDGLTIVYPGLYYVYSSIQIKPKSGVLCQQFKYQTFAAYIERVSYRVHGSQNILKCAHSCCDECENTEETQYTGGIFLLERKDQIRVRVYGETLVDFTPETSFVGLAMLGGPDLDPNSDTEGDK